MPPDLLDRKASHFVLWRPRYISPPPRLIIGKLKPGNPLVFVEPHSVALQASPKGSNLWEIPVAARGPNPFAPGSEYVVPHWPLTPPGKSWREITQDREVPHEWVGREPIFPWEAKVYALF
jgi:hypothetical protein